MASRTATRGSKQARGCIMTGGLDGEKGGLRRPLGVVRYCPAMPERAIYFLRGLGRAQQ